MATQRSDAYERFQRSLDGSIQVLAVAVKVARA